jgi:hypothetical protein
LQASGGVCAKGDLGPRNIFIEQGRRLPQHHHHGRKPMSTYIQSLHERMLQLETERQFVTDKVDDLKREARDAGVHWPTFVYLRKLRTSSPEQRLAAKATYAQGSVQLALFEELYE